MSNKDKSTKPEKPTKAQQLAAIIIDQLERNTAPWQKPWKGGVLQLFLITLSQAIDIKELMQ